VSKRSIKRAVNKTTVLEQAGQVAARMKTSTAGADEVVEAKNKRAHRRVQDFLCDVSCVTEQDFLKAVTEKMQGMVADSLGILHDKLHEIPPQHLAYAVGVIMDKYLTLSGRPSNITASASVRLGNSEMSPEQVRSILKGSKRVIEEQTEIKVTDASEG
tara:strand:+ start:372 stop:848 length:477 start_codon:yes stop_codon:yes gene_type:complete